MEIIEPIDVFANLSHTLRLTKMVGNHYFEFGRDLIYNSELKRFAIPNHSECSDFPFVHRQCFAGNFFCGYIFCSKL